MGSPPDLEQVIAPVLAPPPAANGGSAPSRRERAPGTLREIVQTNGPEEER